MSYHTCVYESYRCALPFTHLISSGETTTLLLSVLLPIGQGLLSSLLPKRGSTGCSKNSCFKQTCNIFGGNFLSFFFFFGTILYIICYVNNETF